jgi:EAL domain-containing protein (putative c-di-GMP-specific phosphodiesterase class I)
MTVVAEGVETQAVAELLIEEGCDFAQGYHFSRPVSAAAIEAEWLSRLPVETAAVS